jgi:ankyrin repeat protein
LPTAARQGNLPLVRLLVEDGARVDAGDMDQLTALHYASMNGDADMVKFLLSKKANARAMSSHSKLPADLASGERAEQIKSLLSKP